MNLNALQGKNLRWAFVAVAWLGRLDALPVSGERKEVPVSIAGYGTVRGFREEISTLNTSIDVFLGLPFAKAPVGELRFAQPVQLATDISRNINATTFSRPCPQVLANLVYDEDCLYLNVWRPAGANTSSRLPVVIVLHGGSFSGGDASNPLWRGAVLAAGARALVVNLNYRLGVFGFMDLGDPLSSGNMGLADQRMAMRWVSDNAAAFGGDPTRVTLAGVGAGATAIMGHMLSPGSRMLFQAAIIDSGSGVFEAPWESTKRARRLAARAGCDASAIEPMVRCMKKLTTHEVLRFQDEAVSPGNSFRPTFGNQFMPHSPHLQINNYGISQVPLIIAAPDADSLPDANVWLRDTTLQTPEDAAQLMMTLADTFNIGHVYNGTRLSDAYKLTKDTTPDELLRAVKIFFSDALFVCNSINFARRHSREPAPTFMFSWEKQGRNSTQSNFGVSFSHLMGLPATSSSDEFDAEARELTLDLMATFGRFFRDPLETPSIRDTKWKRFYSDEDQERAASSEDDGCRVNGHVLVFREHIELINEHPRSRECHDVFGFFEKFDPKYPGDVNM